MDPYRDIYRKSDTPYHASRRSRRLVRPVATPPTSDAAPLQHAAPPPAPPPPGASKAPAGISRHRRRRHVSIWRLFLSTRLNTLLIGFSLLVGGVMMLVVLVKFFGYREATEGWVRRKTEAPPVAGNTNQVGGRVLPDDMAARIAAWRKLPVLLIEVESLREKKRTEQAEAALNNALVEIPRAASLHLELARLLAEGGRSAEAVEHVTAALDVQPSDLEARLLLARMLAQLNEHDLSGKVAEWMIEADPYSPEARRIAADALLKTGQPRAAVSHLRKMASLEFDNLDVNNDLANAYSLAGDHEQAIQTVEGLLQKDPAYAPAYFTLAVCYARQSMTNEALEVLHRASTNVGGDRVSEWLAKPELEGLRKASLTEMPEALPKETTPSSPGT